MFQNTLKNIVFFLALTLMAQQSHAMFVVTPSMSYKSQNIKLTDNADVDTEIKMANPAYGLSLGIVSMTGVGFDIAANYVAGKSKFTVMGVEQEVDYNQTTAGAQLSLRTNSFKIHLGYIFMNEVAFKSDTPNMSSKMKGPGYQAGVTVFFTQALSLGAQYDIYQYNQVNQESVGSYEDIKLHYKKVDAQATMITLGYTF